MVCSDGERRRGMTSLRLVLDLDQTLIHALDQSECPANAKEIADCVVPVCHNGLEFNVAVRRGATRLVQQWKARRDVDLCIGTSNLLAREILTAVSSAQPAWNDIPLHIFASRERGAKSLGELESRLGGKRLAEGRTIIIDDQPLAWAERDRPSVLAVAPFFVTKALPQSQFAAELAELDRASDHVQAAVEALAAPSTADSQTAVPRIALPDDDENDDDGDEDLDCVPSPPPPLSGPEKRPRPPPTSPAGKPAQRQARVAPPVAAELLPPLQTATG